MAVLRPTVPADVPGIHALIGEIYAEYGFAMDLAGTERPLVDPGPYFRERGGEFWVVDEDGAVRGTVGVWLHADAGELKSLYVHHTLRRQGWGRALVTKVIEYTKAANRPRTILWSDTRFLDAHRLYERMAFHRRGLRDLHDLYNSREILFERPFCPEVSVGRM